MLFSKYISYSFLILALSICFLVPRSQSALFVESGQRVILSCFGYGDWSGSEAAFVQWKRWTQVVLQWKSGSLYVDPVFEGRVSVPKDRIIHGDMSLIFNDTHLEDQGYYVCFFKKNDDIRPSTIINLTVTGKYCSIATFEVLPEAFILKTLTPFTQISLIFCGGNLPVKLHPY